MSLPNFLPIKSIFFIRPFYLVVVSAACVFTSGCASSTPKSPAIPIPANLDSSCPGLERLTGVTGREVLAWATLTVRMYADCQAKVDGLREAWPK